MQIKRRVAVRRRDRPTGRSYGDLYWPALYLVRAVGNAHAGLKGAGRPVGVALSRAAATRSAGREGPAVSECFPFGVGRSSREGGRDGHRPRGGFGYQGDDRRLVHLGGVRGRGWCVRRGITDGDLYLVADDVPLTVGHRYRGCIAARTTIGMFCVTAFKHGAVAEVEVVTQGVTVGVRGLGPELHPERHAPLRRVGPEVHRRRDVPRVDWGGAVGDGDVDG